MSKINLEDLDKYLDESSNQKFKKKKSSEFKKKKEKKDKHRKNVDIQ